MSKHTFSTLIFGCVVLLSPAEGKNGKLLTWWLQMPDKASFLIGLHGASVSLIGWDYGITERRQMSGECWNWKKTEMVDHARLIICWLTLSAGEAPHLRGKTKQVGCSSDLNVRTLLIFISESSHRQSQRLLVLYACIKSYLFCWCRSSSWALQAGGGAVFHFSTMIKMAVKMQIQMQFNLFFFFMTLQQKCIHAFSWVLSMNEFVIETLPSKVLQSMF